MVKNIHVFGLGLGGLTIAALLVYYFMKKRNGGGGSAPMAGGPPMFNPDLGSIPDYTSPAAPSSAPGFASGPYPYLPGDQGILGHFSPGLKLRGHSIKNRLAASARSYPTRIIVT